MAFAQMTARAEVDLLIGDFPKARTNLAWKPKTNFQVWLA